MLLSTVYGNLRSVQVILSKSLLIGLGTLINIRKHISFLRHFHPRQSYGFHGAITYAPVEIRHCGYTCHSPDTLGCVLHDQTARTGNEGRDRDDWPCPVAVVMQQCHVDTSDDA
eukprot:TRINITY_DN35950_c0_g1_i1.p3 TRINITY_DN35950_c0_g1~~TRINITY_DN35950_c0_g1_i1.p3  ORF type:complete len:114 (-),score=0.87 TRINITY_DN35950_c0_g1_i1:409-750(-)